MAFSREERRYVVRDPIHNYISFNQLEREIINTEAVQRLRLISQTLPAAFVYPGAIHVRFSHCLGAMHLAGIAAHTLFHSNGQTWERLDRIRKKLGNIASSDNKTSGEIISQVNKIAEELAAIRNREVEDAMDVQILRLAALLHDVGHACFSHTFEEVLFHQGFDWTHENMTRAILLKDPEINEILDRHGFSKRDKEKLLFTAVRPSLNEENKAPFYSQIVSGDLDVDRMDYLVRDAHYCGTIEHGAIDAFRLLLGLTIAWTPSNKKVVAYHEKSRFAISRLLKARQTMFEVVYYHKTARAVSLMFRDMMSLAFEDLFLSKFDFTKDWNQLTEEDLQDYYDFTDDYVFALIKSYRGKSLPSPLKKSHEILKRMFSRRLYKAVSGEIRFRLYETFLHVRKDPNIIIDILEEKCPSPLKDILRQSVVVDLSVIKGLEFLNSSALERNVWLSVGKSRTAIPLRDTEIAETIKELQKPLEFLRLYYVGLDVSERNSLRSFIGKLEHFLEGME